MYLLSQEFFLKIEMECYGPVKSSSEVTLSVKSCK